MSQDTPFPFLEGCKPAIIQAVNKLILGPYQKKTNSLILEHLNGSNMRKYENWIYAERQKPPREAMMIIDPTHIAKIYDCMQKQEFERLPFVFSDLDDGPREILWNWYEQIRYPALVERKALDKARILLQSFNRKNDALQETNTPNVASSAYQTYNMRYGSSSGISSHHNASMTGETHLVSVTGYGAFDLYHPTQKAANPSDQTSKFTFPKLFNMCFLNNKKKSNTEDYTSIDMSQCEELNPQALTVANEVATQTMGTMFSTDEDYNFWNQPVRTVKNVIPPAPVYTLSPAILEENKYREIRHQPITNSCLNNVVTIKKGKFMECQISPPVVNGYTQYADVETPKDDPIIKLEPQVPQKKIIEEMYEENVYNVLLLGETGVGKTTFINGLANYVKYASLDEALQKMPDILIKTSFTTHDDNMETMRITVDANIHGGEESSMNEEFNDRGRSQTQQPFIHSIKWEENGVVKTLRIIDTPGVNDTRGFTQDRDTFEKIMKLIGRMGKLTAICILLKGNVSRLSAGFRNCLDSILAELHRSATKNILFCFTNTRSNLYTPGDSIDTLLGYLEELEQGTGVVIKVNKHNTFCFDNDCFRYLCLLLKMPNALEKSTHDMFSEGWKHNLEKSKELLKKIQGLVAHQVEDTVNINKTRKLFAALAEPLTETALNLRINIRSYELKIKEIKEIGARQEHFGSIVNQTKIVMYQKKLNKPRTVCTNGKCNNYEKDEDGEPKAVPTIICHDNCGLLCVQSENPGASGLNICKVFDPISGYCKKCGCIWNHHRHIKYEIIKREESATSPEQLAALNYCKNEKQKEVHALEDLQTQLDYMKHENSLINESCRDFSAFLQFNSFKSGIDPYSNYLNQAINMEKNKAKHGGNKHTLVDLKIMLNQYNNGVASIMTDLNEKRRPTLTSKELINKIENLRRMKMNGEFISKIIDSIDEEP